MAPNLALSRHHIQTTVEVVTPFQVVMTGILTITANIIQTVRSHKIFVHVARAQEQELPTYLYLNSFKPRSTRLDNSVIIRRILPVCSIVE